MSIGEHTASDNVVIASVVLAVLIQRSGTRGNAGHSKYADPRGAARIFQRRELRCICHMCMGVFDAVDGLIPGPRPIATPPRLHPDTLQLVTNHQVQRPAAARSYAPRKQHKQQQGAAAQRAQGWPLAAVRADQAADIADSAAIELISDITRGVDQAHAAALQRNAAAALEGLAIGEGSELKQKVRKALLASSCWLATHPRT